MFQANTVFQFKIYKSIFQNTFLLKYFTYTHSVYEFLILKWISLLCEYIATDPILKYQAYKKSWVKAEYPNFPKLLLKSCLNLKI